MSTSRRPVPLYVRGSHETVSSQKERKGQAVIYVP